MNIKLKNNWVLTKNPNNIILGKVVKRKNKFGEFEEHIQNIGYYTTPFNAVLGYLKYGIRDSSAEKFIEDTRKACKTRTGLQRAYRQCF